MLWITTRFRVKIADIQPQRLRLWRLIVSFWRFSSFYGEYQSLPISQRRRFVQDYEKAHSQKTSSSQPCTK